jgi:hypothetical protein
MTDGDEEAIHPLLRLKKQAEEQRERREKEVVHCPECGTEVVKDSIEAAIETAETHDESRHDGEPTTKVNGIVPPEFSEDEKKQIQDAVRSLDAGGETDG